jgi:hypothetical protein
MKTISQKLRRQSVKDLSLPQLQLSTFFGLGNQKKKKDESLFLRIGFKK